jgi:hypothetical protein
MAHFTQLGISTNQDQKPQGKTPPRVSPDVQPAHSKAKHTEGRPKIAVLIGSLIATTLLGVFVLESGCSKESGKTVTIAAPNETVASPAPTQMLTAPDSASTAAAAKQPPAKKKSRQRKLSASTYTNSTFGISFQYPKYGYLMEGDEVALELDDLGLLGMNFVRPGGTAISVVELPRKSYAGTDFNSAFFNVSVNPKLSADECEQFASVETDDSVINPSATSKKRVGATEFQAVEGFPQKANNQADVKYYHVFQNGSCYEFALGLETVEEATPDKIKPAVKQVDRNEVFRKLNWILSTVKIQPVATPEKSAPEVATDTPPVPTNTEISAAH